jgi:hypothetical protein
MARSQRTHDHAVSHPYLRWQTSASRHYRAPQQRHLRTFGCPNATPPFLLYATLGGERSFLTHGPGGTAKTVGVVSDGPRFEPHSGWAALPVQPPSGTWQLRLARVYPVFLTNFVLLVAAALTGHQYFVIGVLFWILLASWMAQGVFLGVVGIRGTQLERRERKLGYTTWTRKR